MAQVLIIDDDEDIRSVLRLVAEDAGHEADLCGEADGALLWLRQHSGSSQHAVIFVDDHMPGMTGRNLLESIAQDTALKSHHRFVLMTADRRAVRLAEGAPALRSILAAVLVKPFDLDVVLDLITQLSGDDHQP